METLKSNKVDWKKIIVVSALVFLATLASAMITWYFLEDANLKEVGSLEQRIIELEKENEILQRGLGPVEGETITGEEGVTDEESPQITN